MALTEKDHGEIRRLTVLKLVLDSVGVETAEQIIAKAKKFEEYIKGEPEPNEKSRES